MWLHTFPTIGSTKIAHGLNAGGCLSDAQRQVTKHAASASQLAFFSGYYAFPIDELQAGLAEGRWRAAAVSSELIFDEMQRDGGTDIHGSIWRAMH